MNKTKLLNCPFCGGEGYETYYQKYTGGPHIYIITCDKCEVRFDGYKLSKEEIIKRWNTRV